MAVKKALPYLIEKDFVILTKSENRTSIHINEENDFIMGLKQYWNITKVYTSGLGDFLKNSYPGATIILFGSYSRGDDIYTSDIDIGVIGVKRKNIDFAVYKAEFGKTINISFFDNFREIHKNMKENLCNGIVLSGAVSL